MSSERNMDAVEAVTERELNALVDAFYARVRKDEALGPVFEGAVSDWPEHLETLTRFWSAVMLTNGAYKGNPMAAHRKHLERFTPAMFDRWLAIWRETTDELMAPEIAAELQAKALRIAQSLQLGLFFELPSTPLTRAPSTSEVA